jgi:hypothetical protein
MPERSRNWTAWTGRVINPKRLSIALVVFALAALAFPSSDPAMDAPSINTSPGPEYDDSHRLFQGIPSVERAPNGRLWVLWYSGDKREGPQNFVVLVTSGDDGKTWSKPKLVIDPPGFVRAFDACLWLDPSKRLRLFWAQAAGHWDGRAGVWAIVTETPDAGQPKWSQPRRISDGVLLNKPIVSRAGEWLFPIALWTKPANLPFINERDKLNLSAEQVRSLVHDGGDNRGANVWASSDRGNSFHWMGHGPFPDSDLPNEHMLIERRDGSLWMLARTIYGIGSSTYGIGSSTSRDGGRTWSTAQPSGISHPSTRFYIRRLRSGRLLLVKNNPPNGKDRSHLTASLSDDDGKTWQGSLLLDDRMNVSYPDGTQGQDGRIYIVYDRERFTAREILMAIFTEDDVLRATSERNTATLRILVNRAGAHE